MAGTVGNNFIFSCVSCGDEWEELRPREGIEGGTINAPPDTILVTGSSSVNGEEWKFEKDDDRCLEKDGVKKPVSTSSAAMAWMWSIAAAMNMGSPAGVMAKFKRGENAAGQSTSR